MNVAFGMKAHSGWAALVVVGHRDRDVVVVDRRRVELVAEEWAKQPYHAAEELKPEPARDVVERGVGAAYRIALREMRAAVRRARERGHDVAACGVLVGSPMPDWSVEEILAVHFRMHKAEGALFREALVRSARACELRLVAIPEKQLMTHASRALGIPVSDLEERMTTIGKPVGSPWGKDQKDAALAALVAWHARSTRGGAGAFAEAAAAGPCGRTCQLAAGSSGSSAEPGGGIAPGGTAASAARRARWLRITLTRKT